MKHHFELFMGGDVFIKGIGQHYHNHGSQMIQRNTNNKNKLEFCE